MIKKLKDFIINKNFPDLYTISAPTDKTLQLRLCLSL